MTRKNSYTQAELDLIRELWGTHSMPFIARKLNRSESAVRYQGFLLGLAKAHKEVKADDPNEHFSFHFGFSGTDHTKQSSVNLITYTILK